MSALRPLLVAALLATLAVPALRAEPPRLEGPVTFLVAIETKPGQAEPFLALLGPVLDAMRHEESFINAVLHRDPENPNRFLLYESWRDLDDLVSVQLRRAYRQAYWQGLPDLLAGERQVQLWQPLRADFVFAD